MNQAHALPAATASLDAHMVRRTQPAMRVSRRSFGTALPVESRALALIEASSTLGADLRFFAICYLAGFIFFLIMLS